MQSEVRDTVGLYLDGKIQQLYSRGDGQGVVFDLNRKTVAEAKAILEALPCDGRLRVLRIHAARPRPPKNQATSNQAMPEKRMRLRPPR